MHNSRILSLFSTAPSPPQKKKKVANVIAYISIHMAGARVRGLWCGAGQGGAGGGGCGCGLEGVARREVGVSRREARGGGEMASVFGRAASSTNVGR